MLMKKIVLILAAVFIAATSFAQKVTVSADAGYATDIYHYGSGDWNPKTLSGFFVEGVVEDRLTEVSGLAAGVRFTYVGLGDYATSMGVKTTWKRGYIDVPVRYVAHFGGFYLNAGPTARFVVAVNHSLTDEATKTTVKVNDLKDAKEHFNVVHFGLGGGLGYEFPFGLRLFADYGYDFTNLIKDLVGGPAQTKGSTVSLGVGYRF